MEQVFLIETLEKGKAEEKPEPVIGKILADFWEELINETYGYTNIKERTDMSSSDLTQPGIFDQAEKKPAPVAKRPENINDMIELYIEMQVNHRIMESRLQKVENRLNTISTLFMKGQDAKID